MFGRLPTALLFFSAVVALAQATPSVTKNHEDFKTISHQFGGIGYPCFTNSDCQSKSCVLGRCVCKSDLHCPPPLKCDKSFIPTCASNKKQNGQSCVSGRQCASGVCLTSKCTCIGNTICSGDTKCFGVGSNAQCWPTNLPIGSNCLGNFQCATSRCKFGKCVCRKSSHCKPSYTCVKRLFKKNKCLKTSLLHGQSCLRSKQCKNGRCWRGKCRCLGDSGCPSGQKCRRVSLGSNYCYAINTRSKGSKCKRNEECTSNKCKRKCWVCKRRCA